MKFHKDLRCEITVKESHTLYFVIEIEIWFGERELNQGSEDGEMVIPSNERGGGDESFVWQGPTGATDTQTSKRSSVSFADDTKKPIN